jgi:phage-related protein (TIGR01555 family)
MSAILDQSGQPYSKSQPPLSFADALMNAQTGMGVVGYDPTVQLEYTLTPFMQQYQCENAYCNSFIIGRLIELPAQHMTREWRTIHIEGDDKGNDVDVIRDAEVSLNVKAAFTEAMQWGDLYGGALLVMGLDGEDLSEPLDPTTVTKGQLTSLTVIDRWQVTASDSFVLDPLAPNFRYPEFYVINTSTSARYTIHSSRCLRFDGTKLPRLAWLRNGRWHASTIQRVLSTVKDFEASMKSSSKAMQEGSVDVYKIEGLYERLTDADGQSLIRNRVKLAADLKSIYRALVIDAKDAMDRQPVDVSGYDALLEKHQDMVCGAAEMPATLLFGRPPTGMDSTGESDTRNWYDTLSIKQEFKLRPLINQFDQVMVRSALGYFPDNYEFDFNPLWQMDDGETATTQLAQAQARQIYLTAGCLKPETVAADLLAEGFSSNLTEEDVDEIADYNEPITPTDNQGNPIDPVALIKNMTASGLPAAKRNALPARTGGANASA